MGSQQRETIFLMQLGDIVHQPVFGSVAAGAVQTNGGAVHIRMAGNTLGARLRKNQRLVAVPAIHPDMPALKRESRSIVVKMKRICIYFPAERGMAVSTIGL